MPGLRLDRGTGRALLNTAFALLLMIFLVRLLFGVTLPLVRGSDRWVFQLMILFSFATFLVAGARTLRRLSFVSGAGVVLSWLLGNALLSVGLSGVAWSPSPWVVALGLLEGALLLLFQLLLVQHDFRSSPAWKTLVDEGPSGPEAPMEPEGAEAPSAPLGLVLSGASLVPFVAFAALLGILWLLLPLGRELLDVVAPQLATGASELGVALLLLLGAAWVLEALLYRLGYVVFRWWPARRARAAPGGRVAPGSGAP